MIPGSSPCGTPRASMSFTANKNKTNGKNQPARENFPRRIFYIRNHRYAKTPYFVFIRPSFSSIGGAPNHKNRTVAAAWTRSSGNPVA